MHSFHGVTNFFFFLLFCLFFFCITVAKRELAFVCEEHYPHSQAQWRPPHACSFALCSQCIRNEVGMSAVFLASLASHVEEEEGEFIDSDEDYDDYTTDEDDYDDDEEEEEEEENEEQPL